MKPYVICIGRQYGSGGREIGKKAADALGIGYYDKMLLNMTAQKSGMNLSFIENTDEKISDIGIPVTGNYFADIANMSSMFYSAGQAAHVAEKKVIQDLAEKESCVIIGRCASSILDENPNCFSVFIYADEDERLERVMKRNDIDEKTARKRMNKINKMRRNYFNFYSDTDWGQPESYDMMISSSKMGVDGCADAIASAFRNFMEKREKEING